ncbi:MAG: esterase/lipase [Gammaproteobacteria bacterium]|jgi:esterase/lipase
MLRPWIICCLLVVLTACAHSQGSAESQAALEAGTFPEPIADFEQHRLDVYDYLRVSSLPNRSDADIRLNLPFELSANSDTPYRGKFLLFHGLSDSTYVWTDFAQALATRGFDVRSLLLPGHGSHPREMLDISYTEWLVAARKHYALWNTDATPFYVGGFSLGGVIATILALEQPDSIDGLFLISPAYHSKLNSLLRWSWLYAWYKPWMFGGLILEDNPVKYNSIPINSGTQYYRATQYLKRKWDNKKLAMPVLMVATIDDSVVDVAYTRRLFQTRFSSPVKQLLIYSNDESITAGANEIIHSSAYQQRRILNQSHLSLVNSPANPLFGKDGTVLVCNGNEYPVFMACMNSPNHWYGAQHTPSPDGTPMARTTYNPDFDSVLKLFGEVFLR